MTSLIPTDPDSLRPRSGVHWTLASLLGVIAINALGGAWYGLSGAPGVPASWLDGSPFDSYAIPSIYLGVIVGGSHIIACALNLIRHRSAHTATYGAAAVLASWIVAQVAIIGYVSVLQPIMLAAATLTTLLTYYDTGTGGRR